MKLLHHIEHVRGIKECQFLPPVMLDIDPVTGSCNLDCQWCCQAASRLSRPTTFMADETMKRIGNFCASWGVKAWRIGGDSEPLLHKKINVLLDSGYRNNIDIGVITNGVYLERIIAPQQLIFIGVSLDAAKAATWSRLKRAPESEFYKIIENVKRIRQMAPDIDLCLKFLRYTPSSLNKDDFRFGILVKSSGRTVFDSGNENEEDDFRRLAETLECRPIVKSAYQHGQSNLYEFNICRATPMSGVMDAEHKFHLCCDARGIYVLTNDYTRNDWSELISLWGGSLHNRMVTEIKPKKCLGCGKVAMNTILEEYANNRQVNFI